MKNKLYMVWEEQDCGGYWNQYETIEDAVIQNPGEEIFEATPKSLGYFELKVERKVVKKKMKKAAQ